MLVASSRLGPYEIVAPLGAGGMGEVYRARDTRLGREVAVKVLPEPFASDPGRQARFEREARAVAALSHPNILAIHDYGTEGAVTYAVMELLEGQTLRGRLAKGPLPWREAVEIGAAIADGLAAAHAKGIIHRDLKPENLFLTADGRVKILDFGLARIEPAANIQQETSPYEPAQTDAGVVMGTAGYMSPEQVRGQSVDARSDLFSFGCVLYEMVTGRRAFQRETAAETMTAILHDEPPDATTSSPPVPAELGRIIRQCLAKSPNQRLQSARDLALGLRATASDPGLTLVRSAPRAWQHKLWLAATVMLASLVGISLYLFLRGGKSPDASPPPAETRQTLDSLAILPLVNATGDPQAESLCDGIADHVSSSLANIRERKLKVRPLTSTIHYKGKNVDPRTVGRELEVQAVITGQLRKEGKNLTIRLELVDTRENDVLWSSEAYQRSLDEILILQEEIARDVAANLGLRLTGEEQKQLTRRPTNDPAAYLLYREGRYQWDKGTPESLDLAIKHFQAAITKDPNFALAYAWQAHTYNVLCHFRPVQDNLPKAKELAGQALLIDPNLAEGHAALGAGLLLFEQDCQRAQKELRSALDLDPKHSIARHLYGYSLAAMGKVKEAIAESEQAVKDDPRDVMANAGLARAYLWDERYQDALSQARKTQEISGSNRHSFVSLGLAYAQLNQYPDAVRTFQEALKLYKGYSVMRGLLGYIYGLEGKRAEAQRILEQLQALPPRLPYRAYALAAVYTGLGEKDQAFHWLNESLDNHDAWIIYLKVDPQWQSLRNDPRFDELLQRMGLAGKSARRDRGVHSVAVLPFQNVGGDPKTEFLSDGVADQIINSLSQVRRRDLKVRPFTSAARYKGKELDVATFGRELSVQMIVTGTLRQLGDDLTISVAVVDVREDNQLWGNTYRGKRGAILDLQDQIARDVAANMRLQLTGEEEKRLTKHYTEDPEAYLLYREALHHFNKFTEEGLTTAIDYCRRAIEKDKKYGLAYAQLGRCYVFLGTIHRGPRKTFPAARTYLSRALAIDAALADAHATLGIIHQFHDWDWTAAQRELKKGVDLDSNMPSWNPAYYGFYLAATGQFPEALAATRRSVELDPLAAPPRTILAQCHNWRREYDEAIAQAQKALELDPNYGSVYRELGLAYAEKAMHEQALQTLRKGLECSKGHPWIKGLLGYAYAKAGQPAEARRVLGELKESAANGRFGCAFAITRIHAALNEKEQAFEWLRKACDERDTFVVFIKVDPTMDNLRTDPRFAQVLKDMGLPP